MVWSCSHYPFIIFLKSLEYIRLFFFIPDILFVSPLFFSWSLLLEFDFISIYVESLFVCFFLLNVSFLWLISIHKLFPFSSSPGIPLIFTQPPPLPRTVGSGQRLRLPWAQWIRGRKPAQGQPALTHWSWPPTHTLHTFPPNPSPQDQSLPGPQTWQQKFIIVFRLK